MTVTADDVERTARDTTVAQWIVASVVMVGSMAAGGFAFHHLREPWGLGVVTALAVDVALAAWLLISRRLRAVGVTSVMGFALELTTMGMTLFLNVGAAVFKGVDPTSAKWLLAVAHGFLPVTLVLVSLAGGEAQLKLQRVRRDAEAAERAAREARLAAERARFDAERVERVEAPKPPVPTPVPAPVARRPSASVTQLRSRPKSSGKSTSRARQAWIQTQLKAGVDVSGADVKARFPDAANGARDVATVKQRLASGDAQTELTGVPR